LILNGTFVKLSLPLIKHDWPKLSTYPEIPLWASELLKPSPSAKQLHFMMLIMLYLQWSDLSYVHRLVFNCR